MALLFDNFGLGSTTKSPKLDEDMTLLVVDGVGDAFPRSNLVFVPYSGDVSRLRGSESWDCYLAAWNVRVTSSFFGDERGLSYEKATVAGSLPIIVDSELW